MRPELPATARAGELLKIKVRTDSDVVLLTVRMGDAPPVPMRWDPDSRRSVAMVRAPESGRQELLFEAVFRKARHYTVVDDHAKLIQH